MSKKVLLAGLFLLCSCSSFSMSKFILTEPHTELGHPLFHMQGNSASCSWWGQGC